MNTVRVGIVGLGLVAASHLKGYACHPHAEVVAICDLDKARADRFASEHGIEAVYTSYEEMLREAPINTVDIATPDLSAPINDPPSRRSRDARPLRETILSERG